LGYRVEISAGHTKFENGGVFSLYHGRKYNNQPTITCGFPIEEDDNIVSRERD